MTVSCPDRRPDLGAYVVGALEPGERAALEAHLPGCPGCRDELAELAGLPGMLARLSPEEVEPAPPPPEDLGGRLVDELGRRRRRTRRVRLSLVAAGCAVLLGIGGAVLATQWTGSDGGSPSTVVAALDHGTGVRARMALSSEPWGTEVALRLSDVTPGTRCRLVAVGEDGRREVAGTWRADYEGNATVRAATAIPLADLGRLVVVADRRGPLVSVPV